MSACPRPLPQPPRAAPPQSRQPITLWQLTIWAYRFHMVQYEADRAEEYRLGRPRAGRVAESLKASAMRFGEGSGCIDAAGTTADEQAHILNAHVQTLPPHQRYALIDAAAKGQMPNWNPPVAQFRVIPSRKGGTGQIRMIWSRKRQPIGCWITFEGVPEAEAELIRARARAHYRTWWGAMRRLKAMLLFERGLTRWKITEIGAPAEPWA